MSDIFNRRYFFVIILFIIFVVALYLGVKLSGEAASPSSAVTAIQPTATLVERPVVRDPVAKTSEQAQIGPKLMINTASANEIASQLKGIGKKTAQLIVDYREAQGPFENLKQLQAVKGIGMAKIEANREIIRFELAE